MTKSFMLLLVVVLALGGAFGGVFAGGVAFGKTQEGEIALPLAANQVVFGKEILLIPSVLWLYWSIKRHRRLRTESADELPEG